MSKLDTGIVVRFGEGLLKLSEVIAKAASEGQPLVLVDCSAPAPVPPKAVTMNDADLATMLTKPVNWQDLRKVIQVGTGNEQYLYNLAHA